MRVALDGESRRPGLALDIEDKVIAHFEDIKGTLIAASIVRLISRAVAGELSQAAAKQVGSGGLGGLLIGLAVEGVLTAADTPDTRSWVTLPARISVARKRIPAGKHTISVRYRGSLREAAIDLQPGGWAVLNFSDLR